MRITPDTGFFSNHPSEIHIDAEAAQAVTDSANHSQQANSDRAAGEASVPA